MKLGIFARTFARPTLDEVLIAVGRLGVCEVQFNFKCAGMSTVPNSLTAEDCDRIRGNFHKRGLHLTVLSGTFNAIHPDLLLRREAIANTRQLIAFCPRLGTSIVSLCSGTRDREDMWNAHPENSSAQAWRDLLDTLDQLLPVAENNGVTLGIEPETGNVIESAVKARQLLDELKSKHLKIIFDAANLFGGTYSVDMDETLEEAFALLGSDIVVAHAKEISSPGTKGLTALGSGLLNWVKYFELLAQADFNGPLIIHNVTEHDAPAAVEFVRKRVTRSHGDFSP